MARVLVVGASGLVGRRLLSALLADGHEVLAMSRHPEQHTWPEGVQTVAWDGEAPPTWGGQVDAAVNLAGERILPQRWSDERWAALRASRVDVTRRLVRALNKQRSATTLIQASAVGFYGANPEGVCKEERAPGDDRLAALTAEWESMASKHRGRTVTYRFGHVLDATGGLLGELLPLYQRRIGGPFGTGDQPWPWVHWVDVVGAIRWALQNDLEGTYNLCAPDPVDAGRFHAMLNLELGRLHSMPIPAWALRLWFRDATAVLTGGQQALPDKLLKAGYRFQCGQLQSALYDLLHPGAPDTVLPGAPQVGA